MSDEGGSTLTGFVLNIVGAMILILGLLIVYFSLITESGIADPRFFTPFGAAVALIGGFMILAKKTG